ncbi:MAG: hypothetical protein ACYDBB_07900 [Armatimonadota bacterium]
MQRLAIVFLALFLLVLPVFAQQTAGKPSLCFVSGLAGAEQEDVPLIGELRKAGFLVDSMGIQQLTAEKMAKYNALIFPEYPWIDDKMPADSSWHVRTSAMERLNPALDAYVKNGGGIVMYGVCFFQTQLRGMAVMNETMKPWGAETLYEQVYDPQRLFHYNKLFAHEYGFTNNLTKHPLTDGLKRIYFPADGYHGPTTCSFKLSPEWSILVHGEASAYTAQGNLEGDHIPDFFIDKVGTYPSAPPIVAVRDYGKGRLAVIGVSPQLAVFGARYFGYGNVLMDVGDGTMPSDFGKLQERLYRWAAEPARQAGTPGGFVETPPTYLVNPDLVAKPIDWATFDPGVTEKKSFRGLIGARTKDGGGSGTVADYVAAAEKAGLQYVAFTEDFPLLTSEKWTALRKACREAGTAKVTAIPGFLFRDNVDARWVVIGDFDFPSKSRLSKDGTRIIDPNWWFDPGNPLCAPIDVGHNPRPFWTYSMYSGMAVKTYEGGKLIDDATAAYLDRQEVEDILAPIVVDLLASPVQVATSAGHSTDILANDVTDLRLQIDRNTTSGELFAAGGGPLVTDWRGFNITRATQGQWGPIPGTERYAIRFAVTSPTGIRRVSLLDGPHVLRRFEVGGAKEFAQTVHLLHDRQRHLMVLAEDMKGNTTITGQLLWQCDQLNVRRMCGDRGNTIDFSVLRTDTGRVFINGPIAPYQRKSTLFGFSPGYCDLPYKYGAPYVDGGLRPVSQISDPDIAFAGQPAQEGAFASRMVHPLSSRDVIVQQSDLIGWFNNRNAHAWAPAEPVVEPRDYTASIRWLDFAKRYHDAGLTMIEGAITFRHDGVLADRFVNPLLHRMANTSNDLLTPAFSVDGLTPGGHFSGLTRKDWPLPFVQGKLAKGGFLTIFPSPWGSGVVMMLEDGWSVNAGMSRPSLSPQFGLQMGGQRVTKGQTIRYRLLVGRGVLDGNTTDQEWRDFIAKMGLSGTPAYAPVATQGKITGTAYVLEGETADYGFATTVEKVALPVRLPICVSPVNPKWSAVIANTADGSFLPVGVIETERKAYATWDTSAKKAELFVGNIVLCDNPDLILTAYCTGAQWTVEVHNPGEKEITDTIRGAVKFPPLASLNQRVTVAPGKSVFITVAKK